MRAHNVIIICSGQGRLASSNILDQTIRTLLSFKRTPILVLGPDGDDFLENCREIEKSDIVFDPNFDGNFFSSVKAGLHATHGAAFVLPLSAKSADARRWQLWLEMEKILLASLDSLGADIVLPVTRDADFAPFLVTPQGVTALKNLPATTDWDTTDQMVRCSLYQAKKDMLDQTL